MRDWAMWFQAGLLVLLVGALIVISLTYQVTVENRLSISSLDARMEVRTKDRYTTVEAARDLASIDARFNEIEIEFWSSQLAEAEEALALNPGSPSAVRRKARAKAWLGRRRLDNED